MSYKLLPCPFCGGEAEIHETYDMETNEVDGYFVWCNNKECECRPETNTCFTEAEAVAAWNTRDDRTCKEIVRCRDCVDFDRWDYTDGKTRNVCARFEFVDVTPDGFCSWGERDSAR